MADAADRPLPCKTCGHDPKDAAWRPDNRIPIALMAMMAVLTMVTFVRIEQTRALEAAQAAQAAEESRDAGR